MREINNNTNNLNFQGVQKFDQHKEKQHSKPDVVNEDAAEKTAGRLYPQQILVDHHSLFPDFPVWPADQKQFHELLCKMDV